MKSITKLVDVFDRILQRDIEIVCERKVIRKGVFILYTIKDYTITMIIKTPTNNKSYDIFYPFDVSEKEQCVCLDYTMDKLLGKKITTDIELTPLNNKFLNKQLKIRYS